MNCTNPEASLEWTAGQNRDEQLAFTRDGRAPLDLTGAVVTLVVMAAFSDEAPWRVFTQDTHEDAPGGRTTLEVDLTEVEPEWRVSGKRLVASLWLVDSQGKTNPWGNYTVQIHPAAPLPPSP